MHNKKSKNIIIKVKAQIYLHQKIQIKIKLKYKKKYWKDNLKVDQNCLISNY